MLHQLVSALVSYGIFGILLLAFIDSAGIPVSVGMDALVILVAVKAPSRAWLGASMAVLGSTVGNLVLFFLARKGGSRFVEPEPGNESRFRRWFKRYGLVTVFIPALVPIPLPLKIFVVSAGALRVPTRNFLIVVVLARIGRYFGEAYLGVKLGAESTHFLKENAWELAVFALGLLVFLYLLVHVSDRFRKRAHS